MIANTPLRLTLALAALLTAGSAHAESRRAAQSLPAPARFVAPRPAAAPMQVLQGRRVEVRAPISTARFGGRDDRYEDRRPNQHGGRDEFHEAEERESHHMEHHGQHHSPGC